MAEQENTFVNEEFLIVITAPGAMTKAELLIEVSHYYNI